MKLGCGVEARREQRVAKKGQRRRRGEWAPVRALAEGSPAQTLAGGVAAAAVSVAAVLGAQPDSAPAAVQQQPPQPGPCVLQKCNRELLGCLSDEKCTGALSPPLLYPQAPLRRPAPLSQLSASLSSSPHSSLRRKPHLPQQVQRPLRRGGLSDPLRRPVQLQPHRHVQHVRRQRLRLRSTEA